MKEIWNRTLNEVEPAPSMVIPCKTDQISEKFQPDPQRCPQVNVPTKKRKS